MVARLLATISLKIQNGRRSGQHTPGKNKLFFSPAVVDLIRREIVGGATVPHSRASTPDFSQVCPTFCYEVLRIRISRIRMSLGLPDPLVRYADPDPAPAPDPSIIKQKKSKI